MLLEEHYWFLFPLKRLSQQFLQCLLTKLRALTAFMQAFSKVAGVRWGIQSTILKIDLEKAYDRLSWDYIRDTLIEVGLSSDWVRNIMVCIQTSQLHVLWNGEKLQPFNPSRGLRQRDPLSPYIFVLCMERLSHIISNSIHEGVWRGVKLSRSGPMLPHLFFVDDMILFSEASPQQMQVMLDCLDTFYSSYGQKINYHKSLLFCSKSVGVDLALQLSELLSIPLTLNLGKYLEVPTIHGRLAKNMFEDILE